MGAVEVARSQRETDKIWFSELTLIWIKFQKLSRCLARRMWDRRVFLVLGSVVGICWTEGLGGVGLS